MTTNLIIALLFIGVAFLVIEIFIPGYGVFGILGLILNFITIVLIILKYPNGVFIVLSAYVFISILLYLLFIFAKKHNLVGNIILKENLNTDDEDKIANKEFLLGKEGITKVPLKPFGVAEFNGLTLDVCSDGCYLEANVKVKIFSIKNNKIIVRKI